MLGCKVLVLTHDCTVNLLIGTSHVYIPCAKNGQRVASGTEEHVRSVQRHYLKAGYGTKVI